MTEQPGTSADIDRRPAGAGDDTIEAVGSVSEALEWVERARGHLYEFHQQMGPRMKEDRRTRGRSGHEGRPHG